MLVIFKDLYNGNTFSNFRLLYVTAWRNLGCAKDDFLKYFLRILNFFFLICELFEILELTLTCTKFVFLVDISLYSYAVDSIHHGRFAMCLGISPDVVPIVLGPQSKLMAVHIPFLLCVIVALAGLAMGIFISCKKAKTEARFQTRINPVQRGTRTHPALEDILGVYQCSFN